MKLKAEQQQTIFRINRMVKMSPFKLSHRFLKDIKDGLESLDPVILIDCIKRINGMIKDLDRKPCNIKRSRVKVKYEGLAYAHDKRRKAKKDKPEVSCKVHD